MNEPSITCVFQWALTCMNPSHVNSLYEAVSRPAQATLISGTERVPANVMRAHRIYNVLPLFFPPCAFRAAITSPSYCKHVSISFQLVCCTRKTQALPHISVWINVFTSINLKDDLHTTLHLCNRLESQAATTSSPDLRISLDLHSAFHSCLFESTCKEQMGGCFASCF